MNESKIVTSRPATAGDAAVDGLLSGIAAGVVMAIYLVLIGVVTGTGLAATLSAFDLGQGVSPVRGAVIHLAVAAIYGMVFSLAYRLIVRRRSMGRGANVIIGLVYGLLLWSITQAAFVAGINVALNSLPAVHFAVVHGIYGVTLGWLIGRAQAE